MKRILLRTAVMFLLVSAMVFTAYAAEEQGVVYDETELLCSDAVIRMGTQTLPEFTQTYGIDLRVDILTSLGDFSDVEDAAAGLYEHYQYGYGEGRNGASLTLLVHTDDSGVALDNYHFYFGGDSDMWTTHAVWNIPDEVYELLQADAWAGDASKDSAVLAKILYGMESGLRDFVLSGGVADSIWSPDKGILSGNEQDPDAWKTKEPALSHVTDLAGLLNQEQIDKLEQLAELIRQEYDFGVYCVTVDDFADYSPEGVFEAGMEIYKSNSLGVGSGKDGLLLLLSLNDRDFTLISYGEQGAYAFDDYAREYLTAFFLEDFGKDNWYDGFESFLTQSRQFLMQARSGAPYTYGNAPMLPEDRLMLLALQMGIILLIPLLAAKIVTSILASKMKNVAAAADARSYVDGALELTGSEDQFLNTSRTKKLIEKSDSESKSDSDTKTQHSDGFSGTSGKF